MVWLYFAWRQVDVFGAGTAALWDHACDSAVQATCRLAFALIAASHQPSEARLERVGADLDQVDLDFGSEPDSLDSPETHSWWGIIAMALRRVHARDADAAARLASRVLACPFLRNHLAHLGLSGALLESLDVEEFVRWLEAVVSVDAELASLVNDSLNASVGLSLCLHLMANPQASLAVAKVVTARILLHRLDWFHTLLARATSCDCGGREPAIRELLRGLATRDGDAALCWVAEHAESAELRAGRFAAIAGAFPSGPRRAEATRRALDVSDN